MIPLLKFSKSNGKLSNRLIFSIPAGYTCPHAGACHTFALLVHGSQRAGSDASAAIQQRKKDGGFVGYAKK